MRRTTPLLLCFIALPLAGCETFLDCTEKMLHADKSAQRQLYEICIQRHEESIRPHLVDRLDAKGRLKSQYSDEKLHNLDAEVKNTLDNVLITQVTFAVRTNQDGKEQTVNLTGKCRIDPLTTKTCDFFGPMDEIELAKPVSKGDWSFSLTAAKGVRLK